MCCCTGGWAPRTVEYEDLSIGTANGLNLRWMFKQLWGDGAVKRVTHVAQDLGVMLSVKKNRRTVRLEGEEIGENM